MEKVIIKEWEQVKVGDYFDFDDVPYPYRVYRIIRNNEEINILFEYDVNNYIYFNNQSMPLIFRYVDVEKEKNSLEHIYRIKHINRSGLQ